jgi:hypothetical protein
VPALLDGVVPPLADGHEVDLEPAEDPGHPLEGVVRSGARTC